MILLLYSLLRNGCRPFIEVYVGEERVLTTSQEYEQMRWATCVCMSLNIRKPFWNFALCLTVYFWEENFYTTVHCFDRHVWSVLICIHACMHSYIHIYILHMYVHSVLKTFCLNCGLVLSNQEHLWGVLQKRCHINVGLQIIHTHCTLTYMLMVKFIYICCSVD